MQGWISRPSTPLYILHHEHEVSYDEQHGRNKSNRNFSGALWIEWLFKWRQLLSHYLHTQFAAFGACLITTLATHYLLMQAEAFLGYICSCKHCLEHHEMFVRDDPPRLKLMYFDGSISGLSTMEFYVLMDLSQWPLRMGSGWGLLIQPARNKAQAIFWQLWGVFDCMCYKVIPLFFLAGFHESTLSTVVGCNEHDEQLDEWLIPVGPSWTFPLWTSQVSIFGNFTV